MRKDKVKLQLLKPMEGLISTNGVLILVCATSAVGIASGIVMA
jgi:hypothetical protein